MIDFIDLFAGVGGFHLGLTGNQVVEEGVNHWQRNPDPTEPESRKQSYHCVWANEWDKYAAKVYTTRFPETPLCTGDIRGVEADSIPDHDLLCAGFPCQAFSVAGKRRGLEEARGTLFYEIARIAERKRPRLLLLENVKGLLSHDEGRSFALILRVLGSVGYRCEWQVLNSKWFGVPQNRERVFIVGHLGEEPTRTVFPITEISGFSTESQGEARGDGSRIRTANTLSARYGKDGSENLIAGSLSSGDGLHSTDNLISNALMEHDRSALASDNLICFERPHGKSGGDKELPSLRVKGQDSQLLRYEIQPLRFLNRNQKNFGDEAMTVDTSNSTGIKQGQRIRRLTPVECERLQGFPDGWTSGVSDTQRYKCMGNAVTVPVIRFLGERIRAVFTQKMDRSNGE